MPYTPRWHDEDHTILRIDIEGQVTWEQYHEAISEALQKLNTTDHPVDIIFHGDSPLPSGNPMPHLKRGTTRLSNHPNTGLIVVVSPQEVSAPIKVLINMLMRVYRIDQSHIGGFVSSMDEALEEIRTYRAKRAVSV